MANHGRDSLSTLMVRIPVLIITLLHTILLIRILGPAGNGIYAFLIANAELGSMAISLNMKGVFTFFVAQARFQQQKVIGLVVNILVIGGVLFGGFIFLTYKVEAPWMGFLVPEGEHTFFYLAFLFIYFLFLLIQVFCDCLLRGNLKFKPFNKFAIFSNSLLLLVLGILYVAKINRIFDLEIVDILGLLLVTQLLNSIIYVVFISRTLKLKIDFTFRHIGLIKPFFTYAAKGYFTDMANFLNKRIDIWFIELLKGITSLGIYALAASLTNFMLLALQPIGQVIMPHLTKMDNKEGGKILMMYARLTFVLVVMMAVSVFLLAGWLIPFLFGQEFEPSVLPVRILLLGVIFIAIRNTFAAYAAAKDKLHYIVYGNLLALISTILLDILLIPSYGIIGASIASVCSYFISSAYLLWRVLTDIKQPWFKAFLFSKGDWNYWKKQIGQ